MAPPPESVHTRKTSKVNKPVSINKPKVNTTLHKKKENEKEKKSKKKKEKENNNSSSGLDEKGNPFPMEDPEGGGDPICPGGYKIDYDFDPFNDPINPPFRCISALKDPSDGPTTNIINKLNNPASNITDLASVTAPAAGGGRSAKRIWRRRRRMRKRKITQRRKKISY